MIERTEERQSDSTSSDSTLEGHRKEYLSQVVKPLQRTAETVYVLPGSDAEAHVSKKFPHKKMFGGVCHLMEGNMFCGVLRDHLILRFGKKAAEEVLTLPDVKPFDITGKPMKGWVMVEPDGFKSDDRLREWLVEARRFVKTLPGKS